MKSDDKQLPRIVGVAAERLDRGITETIGHHGAYTVWFFSSDWNRYEWLRDHLPEGWTMPVPGGVLNGAAQRLRETLVNLDAEAWPQSTGRSSWDRTLLAERGPFASTLALNLSRAMAVVELARTPGNHVVIADGLPMCRALLGVAASAGAEVSWLYPGGRFGLSERLAEVIGSATQTMLGVRRRLSFLLRFLQRKWQLRRLRRRYPIPAGALKQSDVMITVWGRAETFSADQKITRETNFGALPAVCSDAGLRISYLSYPLTYTAPFERLAENALRARDDVVLVEDTLPWWAGLAAMWSGFDLKRRVRRLTASGHDVTPFLKLEAGRERAFPGAAEAQLMAYVGRGLVRLGFWPKVMLHLYEGQPWEKMLAHGLRRALPDVRIAGLQHAPFAYEYLSFFPSRQALKAGAVPDVILTSGPGYASWLRDGGFRGHQLTVAGAVRYASVEPLPVPAKRSVLCCTGIELQEACELASKAVVATQALGLPLAVNFHPVTDEAFRNSVRDAVERVSSEEVAKSVLSSRPMRDLLPEADIVLYCTSASCFDAVLAGRIAIFVGPDLGLDYDKMPEDLAIRVRTVEELRNTLADAELSKCTRQTPRSLAEWLAPVITPAELRGALLPPRAVLA